MSEEKIGLENLKSAVEGPSTQEKSASKRLFSGKVVVQKIYERKVDKLGRAYSTGKRKNAIARVWVKVGSGKIIVGV